MITNKTVFKVWLSILYQCGFREGLSLQLALKRGKKLEIMEGFKGTFNELVLSMNGIAKLYAS